ncbi:MAG TPA: hypothetical protein VH539_20375 [Gemmatimonadaceae bacterium]|jgi:hypothetical protein
MNRILGYAAMIALLATTPAAAFAQSESEQTKAAGAVFDRWLTHPKAITLASDQRHRVDSLRGAYIKEEAGLHGGTKDGAARMQVVIKVRALATKYQKAVRDGLKPEQQAVFDKNLDAQKGTSSPTNDVFKLDR